MPAEGGVKDTGGDGDADTVVDEGEEQVLPDVGHGGAADGDGGDDAVQRARHQGDVGGFDGDVGAGADREANVGGGERGCVVDTVTDHSDAVTLGLQALDLGGFVLGEHFGQDRGEEWPSWLPRCTALRLRRRAGAATLPLLFAALLVASVLDKIDEKASNATQVRQAAAHIGTIRPLAIFELLAAFLAIGVIANLVGAVRQRGAG